MDQHLEHLHLTFLTLSPSLYLLWMNLAAQSVFESPLLYATHASWMFERGGTHDERRDGSGEQSDLRSKLEELAQAGDRATVWGRGTSLACWAGDGLQRKAHRAEVVVQSFDADGSYSPPTDVSLALSLDAVKSKGYFARPAVRAEELEAMIWEHLACRSLRAHCEVLGLLCMHALWNTYSGYIVEGIFFIPAVSSLLRCEEVIYIHLTLTHTTDASQSRGAGDDSLSNLGSRSLPPPRPSALLLVPMSDTDDEKNEEQATRYVLVGTPFSTFTRSVALFLRAKSLKYHQLTSVTPHSAEAVSYNPLGFIPVLVDSNSRMRLTESIAIMSYLERMSPDPPMFTQNPRDLQNIPERVMELCSFAASHLFPKIEFGLVKPRLAIMDALSGPPTAEEEAAIVESITPGIQALHPVLIALEQMMGNGPYAVGRRMTAADCMLYPPLADLLAVKEGEILDGYIRISAWLNFFRSTSVAGDTKEGTLEVGGRP